MFYIGGDSSYWWCDSTYIWTRHFLVAQGKPVPVTTIHQDNKSIILLSENGKASSSKCTKHLDVCYFFVTDRIKQGKVKVAYCPMENMLAGFFTKTLNACKASNLICPPLTLSVKCTGVCWKIEKVMGLKDRRCEAMTIDKWWKKQPGSKERQKERRKEEKKIKGEKTEKIRLAQY